MPQLIAEVAYENVLDSQNAYGTLVHDITWRVKPLMAIRLICFPNRRNSHSARYKYTR